MALGNVAPWAWVPGISHKGKAWELKPAESSQSRWFNGTVCGNKEAADRAGSKRLEQSAEPCGMGSSQRLEFRSSVTIERLWARSVRTVLERCWPGCGSLQASILLPGRAEMNQSEHPDPRLSLLPPTDPLPFPFLSSFPGLTQTS